MADLKSLKLTTASDAGIGGDHIDLIARENTMLNAFQSVAASGFTTSDMTDGFTDTFLDSSEIEVSTDKEYDAIGLGGSFANNTSTNFYIETKPTLTKISHANTTGLSTSKAIPVSNTNPECIRNGRRGLPAGNSNEFTCGNNTGTLRFDFTFPRDVSIVLCKTYVEGTDGNRLGPVVLNYGSSQTVANSVDYADGRLGWWDIPFYASGKANNEWSLSWVSQNGSQRLNEIEMYAAGVAQNTMFMSTSTTAASVPTAAHLVFYEEDVDAVTINTDLVGFVSRDAGRTFTTDFGTDEKLDIATNGLTNNERVTVSSSTTLPAGLSNKVVYYVVNASTNDFELSLTESGTAVNITDNGTGTHTARVWTTATLVNKGVSTPNQNVIADDDIVLSNQPSGTAMRWMVETLNVKHLKLHGISLQWR